MNYVIETLTLGLFLPLACGAVVCWVRCSGFRVQKVRRLALRVKGMIGNTKRRRASRLAAAVLQRMGA